MNNLACMLALVAASSAGFTACSSDDPITNGDNQNGVAGKMVKTSFALNIPYGKSTRMTSNVTQSGLTTTFRGMSDMRLLSFNSATANVDGSATAVKKIVLGSSDDAFEQDDHRRIYRDVVIPVGTKSFIFYGQTDKAFTTTDKDLMNDKFSNGIIKASETLTGGAEDSKTNDNLALKNVTFNLEKIYNGSIATDKEAQDIIENLAKVYNTKGNIYTTDKNNQKKTIEVTWSAITTEQANQYPVLKHAKQLFEQFKTLKAGSANSARAALKLLFDGCGRDLKNGIIEASEDDLLYEIANNANEAQQKIKDCTFPNNLGLPDGAAQGAFGSDGNFEYSTGGAAMNNNKFDYTKAVYPASLNYYVQTDLAAKNDVVNSLNSTNGWPTYDNWKANDASNWTGWGTEVTNDTRTIGLKDAIKYGVAKLATTVTITSNHLTDNGNTVGKLNADQSIDVTSKGFKLTGVLVGGQPEQVGWDYTATAPEGGITGQYDYTVYDRNMDYADNVLTNGKSTTNYTLLLDNDEPKPTEGGKSAVYVTIELVNNTGTAFYGVDGVVPDGGTFYLVGQLDPNTASYTGTQTKPDHVFKKAYTTTATLKIGEKSLKHAYNCLPDLRSTSISLGLAIDLKWETGLDFEVEL